MPRLTRRAVIAAGVALPHLSNYAAAADLGTLIGPLLMLGFAGNNSAAPDAGWIRNELSQGAIGGVCFLGHNTRTRSGIESLTATFRSAPRRRAALIAVDQEGGAVQRLSPKSGYPETPGAAVIAAQGDGAAVATYSGMARMLRGAGFNLNLAPVVDLGHEKRNPIIAKYGRAYGETGAQVARYAAAFCRGHRQAGMLTCLKHFPGHGSTLVDSHKAPVDLTQTWSEDELVPYRTLVQQGLVDMVMSGHLSHANMGGQPATLSRVAIEDVLRAQCGWQGVVMTDDVDMAAIRSRLQPAQAAVAALAAGNDIVLMSNTAAPDSDLPRRVVAAVRDAIGAGRLSVARIEQAHARVDALTARAAA
jgi:beta-N-acetylhexosaminidase